MALNWTWALSSYTTLLLFPANGTMSDNIAFIVAGNAAMATTFIALGLFRNFLGKNSIIRGLDIIGLVASITSLSMYAFASTAPTSMVWSMAAWILGGISSALMLMRLGVFFSSLDQHRTGGYIGFMLMATSFLYFIITSTSKLTALILTCTCLVLASAASLFLKVTPAAMDRRALEGGESAEMPISVALGKKASRLSRIHFFAMLFYGVAFGYSSFVGISQSSSDDSLLLSSQIAIMLAALLLLALDIWKRGSFEYALMQWPLLILIVIGLLPLPYSDGALAILCSSILLFGFSCYDVVNWLILSDLGHRYNPIFTFGFGRGFLCLGLLVGRMLWWLAASVAGGESLQIQIPMTIVILLFCTIMIISLPLLKPTGTSLGNTDDAENTWNEACTRLARSHDLTARETEVFQLLAKGWGQKAINEKLVISPHTAKAHISHIYSKLEVHSRHELMQMVEKAQSDEGPRPSD